MIRESIMTNASFWSLLLFSLCVHAACLPVVSPCERYAMVNTAAEDYRMESEVSSQLNSTVCGQTDQPVCEENEVSLKRETSRTCRAGFHLDQDWERLFYCRTEQSLTESRSIINIVCRRHFKLSSVPGAKRLTKEVLTSLDCPCPPKQRQRRKERGGPAGGERGSGGGQPGRGGAGQRGEGGAGRGEAGQRDTRQLCRLKLSLESLKLCYQALASGHGPGT